MSGSRETILSAVRRSLETARAEVEAPADPSAEPEVVVPRPVDPVDPVDPVAEESRLEAFRVRLESVGGVVHVVESEAAASACLEGLLAERGVTTVALSDAPLVHRVVEALASPPQTLPPGAPREELLAAGAGLTSAQAGIAETGTLVLDGDEEAHRLASLVPPVHVALLDARTIVADLDEALAAIAAKGSVPAAVTFVTGPSRTADIELTLVVGVHGPRELHVICLDPA